MLIDTHAHMNIMVKKKFDIPLTPEEIVDAKAIIEESAQYNVTGFINVGTSLIESINCIRLAQTYQNLFAAVGIHPNDCSATWRDDMKEITQLVEQKNENKIVGIGECGLDKHYLEYDLPRQIDAFKAQIELALRHALPIIIHTRDAQDETIEVLEYYKNEPLRGVVHCFSGDHYFADYAIKRNFALGIGGPLTYPKNTMLREIFATIPLENIVLETDAPFLPPQQLRGKENHPKNIAIIAQFLADIRTQPLDVIAYQTTYNVERIFNVSFSSNF